MVLNHYTQGYLNMKRTTLPMFAVITLMTGFVSLPAKAELNVFTEHNLIHMVEHKVRNDYAPTGDLPYIGKIGLEYNFKNLSYSGGYIHRSNADIPSNESEYSYDGIFIGIKLRHCIYKCI